MGVGRTQSEAEKQKEQERRRAEQAKWSDAQQWFSNYYGRDQKVSRLYWERIEGEQSDAELQDLKAQQAAIAQASIGQPKDSTFRMTDGLFKATRESKYHNRETNRNFFIELKEGSARPRPPLRESEFASHQSLYMEKFNDIYGQIMDFMAVQCGYSSLIIDLPDMSPVISQYDYMRMNALLALAEKRGLEIEFGPKVMEVLRDRPNDYARYKEEVKRVNDSAKAGAKTDALHQYEYQKSKVRFDELSRPEAANYKTKLEADTNVPEPLAKLNALDKSVSEVEARLKNLESSVNALDGHIDAYTQQVEGAKDEKSLAAAERYVEKAAEQRDALIAAMKVERDALGMMQAALQERYDAGIKGADITKSADGKADLKEAAKEAEITRRDGVQGRLEKIDAGVRALSDDRLNKIQADRINALKAKTEDKKKALQAQQKPGGP